MFETAATSSPPPIHVELWQPASASKIPHSNPVAAVTAAPRPRALTPAASARSNPRHTGSHLISSLVGHFPSVDLTSNTVAHVSPKTPNSNTTLHQNKSHTKGSSLTPQDKLVNTVKAKILCLNSQLHPWSQKQTRSRFPCTKMCCQMMGCNNWRSLVIKSDLKYELVSNVIW